MAYIRYPAASSTVTPSFPILAPDGSVSAPSYANSTGKTGLYFSGETLLVSANQTNVLTASSTALTVALPIKEANGTATSPSFTNSTGKTGMYFSGETARFAANSVGMGAVSATQGWSLGITGFNSFTVVTADGSAWLSNANETGYYVQHSATSASTSSCNGFYSDITTSANAFTCGTRYNFYTSNRAAGAGSTITRDVGYGGIQPSRGGTGNAMFSDNTAFTGNFFLHQSGTNDSSLAGALTTLKYLKVTNAGGDPGAVTDAIAIGSVDLSPGNATMSLRTETAIVSEVVACDRTLSIQINGTTYKLMLKS